MRRALPWWRCLAIGTEHPSPHWLFPWGIVPQELGRLRGEVQSQTRTLRTAGLPFTCIRLTDASPGHLPRGRLLRLADATPTAHCGLIRWVEALLGVARRNVT